MKKTLIERQRTELKKICAMYWRDFGAAELKHDKVTPDLIIYSDGKDYILFATPRRPDLWHFELTYRPNEISFRAKEISEKAFNKALKFILREYKNKKINPINQKKIRKEKIEKQIEELQKELSNF